MDLTSADMVKRLGWLLSFRFFLGFGGGANWSAGADCDRAIPALMVAVYSGLFAGSAGATTYQRI